MPLMGRDWHKPARLFCVCVMAEPWTRSGLVKGIGIPAPSGERSVGCVDLMHKVNLPQTSHISLHTPLSLHHYLGQFEGDDHGGLLVRLFYPAQLNPGQPPGSPSTYAPWNPHKRYIHVDPASCIFLSIFTYIYFNTCRYVKAYLEFQKTWGPGLIASITNTFLSKFIPSLSVCGEGMPIVHCNLF